MVCASVLILYTTTNFDSKEHKSYKATRALAKTLRTVIDPHRDQLLACMVSPALHRLLAAALAGLGLLTRECCGVRRGTGPRPRRTSRRW